MAFVRRKYDTKRLLLMLIGEHLSLETNLLLLHQEYEFKKFINDFKKHTKEEEDLLGLLRCPDIEKHMVDHVRIIRSLENINFNECDIKELRGFVASIVREHIEEFDDKIIDYLK